MTLISHIQDWYKMLKGKWWFLLLVWFLGAIIMRLLDTRVLPPLQNVPQLKIVYSFYQIQPLEDIYEGNFKFTTNQEDSIYGIQFKVCSIGGKQVKNFAMFFELTDSGIKIIEKSIKYYPTILAKAVIDSFDNHHRIYRKLSVLPCETEIFFRVRTSLPISDNCVNLEFLSESRNWKPKYGKIKLIKSMQMSLNINLNHIAFADTLNNKNKDTNISSLDHITKQERAFVLQTQSIFDFGGYDVGLICFWIDYILAISDLIDSTYLNHRSEFIRIDTDEHIIHAIFDPLQRCEALLNLFIRQKLISYEEANNILEKSQKAGGISIGGYNIFFILASILDVLYEHNYITLDEGQQIIDVAKTEKSPWE